MNHRLYLSIFLLSLVSWAWSQTPAEQLQIKLNAISTMSAHFSQVVKARNREVSRSSGTMALQRPGHFRWKTTSPMEQLIVADGQHMWIYDVALEQVTVKKQEKGLGGTAALFLSGYDDNITKDFSVSASVQNATTVFDLHAKAPRENFQNIQLLFKQDRLTGIKLYDQLGQVTSVSLEQIKTNQPLVATLFQFKPPKGVDVVRQ